MAVSLILPHRLASKLLGPSLELSIKILIHPTKTFKTWKLEDGWGTRDSDFNEEELDPKSIIDRLRLTVKSII